MDRELPVLGGVGGQKQDSPLTSRVRGWRNQRSNCLPRAWISKMPPTPPIFERGAGGSIHSSARRHRFPFHVSGPRISKMPPTPPTSSSNGRPTNWWIVRRCFLRSSDPNPSWSRGWMAQPYPPLGNTMRWLRPVRSSPCAALAGHCATVEPSSRLIYQPFMSAGRLVITTPEDGPKAQDGPHPPFPGFHPRRKGDGQGVRGFHPELRRSAFPGSDCIRDAYSLEGHGNG